MKTYECPKCGEDVAVDSVNDTECPECHAKLRVNPDAEFVNGLWYDLTTLSEI